MPISKSSHSKYPGLKLKAWAIINTTAGGIVRGSGFNSFTRSAAGTYAATITTALADAFYVVDVKAAGTSGAGSPVSSLVTSMTTTTFTLVTVRQSDFTGSDAAFLHVAVYG